MKTGITADEQLQNRARKREKLEEQQYVEDLRQVMAAPQGRRFIYRILAAHCGRGVVPHTPGPASLEVMAYESGRAFVGDTVIAELLAHAPRDYAAMMRDAITELQTSQGTLSTTED